jgi:hypothetical protein
MLIIAALMDEKSYLDVTLIYFSLITNDVEHSLLSY